MVQNRSILLYVILSFVTCGFFTLYWFVCLTNDTNFVSGEQKTTGGMALLLTVITCGFYGFYWAYKLGDKLDIAKQKRGIPASNGGILYLILYLFGGIFTYILVQNELNKLL